VAQQIAAAAEQPMNPTNAHAPYPHRVAMQPMAIVPSHTASAASQLFVQLLHP